MADISNVNDNGNSNNLSDLNDDEINIEIKSNEIVKVPELGEVTLDVKALQRFVQKLDSDDEVTDFTDKALGKHLRKILPELNGNHDKSGKEKILKQLLQLYQSNDNWKIEIDPRKKEDSERKELESQIVSLELEWNEKSSLLDNAFRRRNALSLDETKKLVNEVTELGDKLAEMKQKYDNMQNDSIMQQYRATFEAAKKKVAGINNKNKNRNQRMNDSEIPFTNSRISGISNKDVSKKEVQPTNYGVLGTQRLISRFSNLLSGQRILINNNDDPSNHAKVRSAISESVGDPNGVGYHFHGGYDDHSFGNQNYNNKRHGSQDYGNQYYLNDNERYKEKLMVKTLTTLKYDKVYDGTENLWVWWMKFEHWCDALGL